METVRIHFADSDDQAKERQDAIVKRLEELGKEHVKVLMASGGLPTHWNPIILAWLKQ